MTDVMAVNLDGSPRAYHPDDIWAGNCAPPAAGVTPAPTTASAQPKACALNVLCYAGVRFFVDGSRPVRCADRDQYQQLWQEMWPLISSGRAVRVPDRYWSRDPQRASDGRYGFFHPEKPLTVLFKNTIIPQSSAGGPCVRDVAGARYQGYFVNKTSLRGSEREDEAEGRRRSAIVTDKRCSPLPYVNAETLPALVIPKGGFAGAKVGDLVVAYRKARDGAERWVYAIVGDEGPNDKFGEGSLALNAALNGHAAEKRWSSYRELVRDTHIGERGAGKEAIGVMIFRGSAKHAAKDLSRHNVERVAELQFRHSPREASVSAASAGNHRTERFDQQPLAHFLVLDPYLRREPVLHHFADLIGRGPSQRLRVGKGPEVGIAPTAARQFLSEQIIVALARGKIGARRFASVGDRVEHGSDLPLHLLRVNAG
jgi:hypothetical protein